VAPSPRSSEPSWLGRTLELEIGPVAHGGHCVARHQGRVLFVRHALPGETVLAEVTEDRGGSFCRADAVRILSAAADRVRPPCPYARPGGCGGCDFQHVALPAQRELKAAVVAEQLSRLAGLDRPVTVQPLDDGDGLGWRRRVRFAVGPDGELGLRAHHSHQVIALSHCPIGAAGVGDTDALHARWNGLAEVEVATDDLGKVVKLSHRDRPAHRRAGQRGGAGGGRAERGLPERGRPERRRTPAPTITKQLSGPPALRYTVAGRQFRIHPAGFWQSHPRAAEVFTDTVLTAAAPVPGERVLELYAGSGLFTAALAGAVTGTGQVIGLESAPEAVTDAEHNLADQPWAGVRRCSVSADTIAAAVTELGELSVVVLDPPRTGAGREVLTAVLAARPRVVIYVACDPAALARDLRIAIEAGWQLAELSAFDAFPMTHHVECIAVLRPAEQPGEQPGEQPVDWQPGR
jgi:tRNA/tmRNA/rRNA uracil-C5-methylase (TrmA/RlmC/RlmD family)